MQILIDIQNGNLGFKDLNDNMIQDNDNMKPYTLQLNDNIAIINATQSF